MSILKDIIDFITKIFQWWVVIMPWEQGIRVTLGRKITLLDKGIFLKIPLIHAVYVQEKRLRLINLPIQTVCTGDGHAITISCAVGYSIVDIGKLYNTLYQPDMTISNIVASKVSDYIFKTTVAECKPDKVENDIINALDQYQYGLKFEYVRIINFAVVKTFRLIQDQSYIYEGLDMLKQK